MPDKEAVVAVPANEKMADEPAVAIGDVFADKAMLKTIIAAAVAIIAGSTGWAADDEFAENLAILISGVAGILTIIMAQWEARKRALAQAQETRNAVYSPASAAAIARAPSVAIVTGPPETAKTKPK